MEVESRAVASVILFTEERRAPVTVLAVARVEIIAFAASVVATVASIAVAAAAASVLTIAAAVNIR